MLRQVLVCVATLSVAGCNETRDNFLVNVGECSVNLSGDALTAEDAVKLLQVCLELKLK